MVSKLLSVHSDTAQTVGRSANGFLSWWVIQGRLMEVNSKSTTLSHSTSY